MAKIQLAGGLHIDARSRQSQVKMYTALVRLMNAGAAFDALKIGAFCREAGVARATFYRHHQDLQDVLAVELLRQINAFEHRVDRSAIRDYQSGSQLIVNALLKARELFHLLSWAHADARALPLIVGAVQRVLILRDYPETDRSFISQWLGAALLAFGHQLAAAPTMPAKQALHLYRLLIPDLPPIAA